MRTFHRGHRAHDDDYRYQWDKAMFLDFGDGQRLYARSTALDKVAEVYPKLSQDKSYQHFEASFPVGRFKNNGSIRH